MSRVARFLSKAGCRKAGGPMRNAVIAVLAWLGWPAGAAPPPAALDLLIILRHAPAGVVVETPLVKLDYRESRKIPLLTYETFRGGHSGGLGGTSLPREATDYLKAETTLRDGERHILLKAIPLRKATLGKHELVGLSVSFRVESLKMLAPDLVIQRVEAGGAPVKSKSQDALWEFRLAPGSREPIRVALPKETGAARVTVDWIE